MEVPRCQRSAPSTLGQSDFPFQLRKLYSQGVPSPARSGELIGQKLGKYELLALIAVGGTAEIYLARISGASGFEKYLVVKYLLDHLADDQEFVRMFLDEARVGAQLDHSNIVQTLELGEQDGRYYLVIEYLAGMSVAQIARKTQERGVNGGLIDTNLVLGMASQTCNGLHYAHRKKVQGKALNLIHRDISPQNLVVSYEGILKIVDFGIAKSDIREAQTRTGTIKGKFAYMSPEQCLAKKIDNRTDIFALGTLCHELLTGRRLFKRQTTYDTYQAIVNGVVPKPSQLNPKLDSHVDDVIMKALAYDPDHRYPTAQAFGEALLGLLHKRNGSGGAGEISRFFEEHFHEDLAAHAEQMREFITGKNPNTKDATWDQEIGGDDSASAAAPVGAPRVALPAIVPPKPKGAPSSIRPIKPSRAVAARPAPARPAPARPAPARLDDFAHDDDDEEGPTRIDFDPGAQMAALHAETDEVDDGWDDDGPTSIAGIGESNAAMPGSSPPPGGPRTQFAPPTAPLAGRPLPPVPATDPKHRPQPSTRRDFAAPPETINVSAVPARSSGPPQAPPGQRPGGQPHAPQALAQSRSNIAHEISTLPGQQAKLINPSQPPAGAVPVQLGGPQPMYPAYVGGALPIAAQGSGAVINAPQRNTGPYPSGGMQPGSPAGQMTASLPSYPTTSLAGENEPAPLWMHAAVFALFVGLGVGIAAFFKMMF